MRRTHPVLSTRTLLRLKRIRAPLRAPARLTPQRRTLTPVRQAPAR
jgi:hypothetical protein